MDLRPIRRWQGPAPELRRRQQAVTAVLLVATALTGAPLHAECRGEGGVDLDRASDYFRTLQRESLAPAYGRLVTSKDDAGAFFTVLSWNDDRLDSRVFGLHAASLHEQAHRRRIWSEVLLRVVSTPTAWREARSVSGSGAPWIGEAVHGDWHDWAGGYELLEASAEVVTQMKLGYSPSSKPGAGLANRVKQLLSAREGGLGLQRAAERGLERASAFGRAVHAVSLLATVADPVVAATLLQAVSTDEAARRARSLVEIARAEADPALLAGAEDAWLALRAVQESDWYEYVRALQDHLPELTAAATVEGSAALAKSLQASPWWRSLSTKSTAPHLLAIAAAVEAVSSLLDQNLTLQRAASLAAVQAPLLNRLERLRGQVLDTEAVVQLVDLDLMLAELRIAYFEELLEATGVQGPLDVAGMLIRWTSRGQRELRTSLEEDRSRSRAELVRAILAHSQLRCRPQGDCEESVQALARGERVRVVGSDGSVFELGAVPYESGYGSVDLETIDWVDGLIPGKPLLRVELIATMGGSGWSRSAHLLACEDASSLHEAWVGHALSLSNGRLIDSAVSWAADDAHCCPSISIRRALFSRNGRIVASGPEPQMSGERAEELSRSRIGSLVAGRWEAQSRGWNWVLNFYADGGVVSEKPCNGCSRSDETVALWRVEPSIIPGVQSLFLYDPSKPWKEGWFDSWRLKIEGNAASIYQVLDGPETPDSWIVLERKGRAPTLEDRAPASTGLRFRPLQSRATSTAAASIDSQRLTLTHFEDAQATPWQGNPETASWVELGVVLERQTSVLRVALRAGVEVSVGAEVLLAREGNATGRALISGIRSGEAELELLEETTTEGPQVGDTVRSDGP